MALSSPWLTLRLAREAVSNKRPDDAHRLIEPLLADGHRKAWRMARDVAKAYVDRGRRFMDVDNPDAAWVELLAAESLNTGEKCVAELRLTLTRFGLVQARGALEAGRPLDAVNEAVRLRERGVRNPDLSRVEEAAQDWVHATELANKGEFLRSLSEIDKLRPKLPCPPVGLDHFRIAVDERHERFRDAVGRLYDAAEAKRWREAIAAAEEVLTAAPEHRDAQVIRAKAWQAAHPETGVYIVGSGSLSEDGATRNTRTGEGMKSRRGEFDAAAVTVNGGSQPARGEASRPSLLDPPLPLNAGRTPLHQFASRSATLPKRFLLWIDGVGGYLVCTGTRVTFGQAALDGPIDVPLFADVSRLHAEVSRDGEGYLIETGKGVQVNGKDVSRATLSPGDRLTLGSTCQFLFHRPVAISSTAKLELTSGHRLLLPVDGVLLMGNELILGRGPQAHVVVEDAACAVSLFRSAEGLGVRVKEGEFRIDDQPHRDRAALPFPGVVSTDTFAFAVEPVGPRG